MVYIESKTLIGMNELLVGANHEHFLHSHNVMCQKVIFGLASNFPFRQRQGSEDMEIWENFYKGYYITVVLQFFTYKYMNYVNFEFHFEI